MKILQILTNNARKEAPDSIYAGTSQLLKQRVADLDKFARMEMPSIAAKQQDALTALEQLSRQAQATIKKA